MAKILYSMLELIAASVAISLAALLIIPDWRQKPQYVFAGWLVGPLLGFIVLRFELHAGFALLAATIGSITAPATVATLHGKSISQVAEELLSLRNKARKGDQEEK